MVCSQLEACNHSRLPRSRPPRISSRSSPLCISNHLALGPQPVTPVSTARCAVMYAQSELAARLGSAANIGSATTLAESVSADSKSTSHPLLVCNQSVRCGLKPLSACLNHQPVSPAPSLRGHLLVEVFNEWSLLLSPFSPSLSLQPSVVSSQSSPSGFCSHTRPSKVSSHDRNQIHKLLEAISDP